MREVCNARVPAPHESPENIPEEPEKDHPATADGELTQKEEDEPEEEVARDLVFEE
jgi:hypothetical protein